MTHDPAASGEIGTAQFVLDAVDNPHPVMLTKALQFRRAAKADPASVGLYWLGYRDAMSDATGEPPELVEAWMDRHDTVDTDALRDAHDAQQAAPVTIGRKPR